MIDIDKIERLLRAGVSHSADIAALIAEVKAWRERFPAHVYRPQDECVANRMWESRHESKRDCPKCGHKDLPAGTYCKGMDCPLDPARGAK